MSNAVIRHTRLLISLLLFNTTIYAQHNSSRLAAVVESQEFQDLAMKVYGSYAVQFSTLKGEVTYQSSAIKKWVSVACLDSVSECGINSNKVPKEALYWRCKLGQVDSVSDARELLVRVTDRLTKVTRPFGGDLLSSVPIPAAYEITDAYIHIMYCKNVKDVRYKDMIVAVSTAHERSTGKWNLILTIGKTEYEF